MKGSTNDPNMLLAHQCDLCHRLADNCDSEYCERCGQWVCDNCAKGIRGRWICEECQEAEEAEYQQEMMDILAEREEDEKRDMGDKYRQERT